MIRSFWTRIADLFKPGPHREYNPDEDPDVLLLRRQRLESKRETQKLMRQQHRTHHVDSLRDRVTVRRIQKGGT